MGSHKKFVAEKSPDWNLPGSTPVPEPIGKPWALRKYTTRHCASTLHDFFHNSAIPDKGGEKYIQDAVESVSQVFDWSQYYKKRGLTLGSINSNPNQIQKNPIPKNVYSITTNESQSQSQSQNYQGRNHNYQPKRRKLFLMAGLYSGGLKKQIPEKFKFSLPHDQSSLKDKKDFQLPWNIYCPSNGERKILKWRSLKKSKLQVEYNFFLSMNRFPFFFPIFKIPILC